MIIQPMVKIGSGFKLPNSIDLSILDEIPVVVHKYGDLQPPKDSFRWMSYRTEGSRFGNIDFARNCGKFFPEVAEYVVEYLSGLFNMKFSGEYVNFMRTRGDIVKHTDEVRRCSINIGIQNTESAITRFYDRNLVTDFRVESGSAYLVNVSLPHSVHADNSTERLLITVGFEYSQLQIHKRLKELNNTGT